jgi:hypothetical protein
LLLAYLLVGLTAGWVVMANLGALARYRASLGGRPASRAARLAWLLSVFSPATGPLVVVAAAVALALGWRERRRVAAGDIPQRSRLPAEMALKTSAVILGVVPVIVICIYVGWRMRP